MFVRPLELARAAAIVAAGALLAGCGPSSELERLGETGPISGPFYVSSYFAPSGHMGDGQEVGHITADVSEGCLPRPAGAGGDCYRFTYVPGEQLWAGVYWVYPANNWGSRPGRNIATKYSRIRFYAAANVEMAMQFLAGGIDDDKLAFRDDFKVTKLAPVTTQYQQFSLDLTLETIDSIVGAFGWVTNYPSGTDPTTAPPTVIYIDDIVWE